MCLYLLELFWSPTCSADFHIVIVMSLGHKFRVMPSLTYWSHAGLVNDISSKTTAYFKIAPLELCFSECPVGLWLFVTTKLFFRWDISVICLIVVLKLAVTVCIALYFEKLWPNWLNFFRSFKKNFSLWPKIDRKSANKAKSSRSHFGAWNVLGFEKLVKFYKM